jgi:hypothetical protein
MSINLIKNKKIAIQSIYRTMKVLQSISQINLKKSIKQNKQGLFELLDINPYKNYTQQDEVNILIGYDQGMMNEYLSIIRLFIQSSKIKFILFGKKIIGTSLPKNEEQLIKNCQEILNNLKKKSVIKFNIYYLKSKKIQNKSFIINIDDSSFSLFHLSKQMHECLTLSSCDENIQRLIATESAKTNAEKMIDELNIKINKIRQNKITTEMLELLA